MHFRVWFYSDTPIILGLSCLGMLLSSGFRSNVLMTTLTQYIQHPRDCQLHAGRRWGCVRRLKGIQTYMLLSGSQSFSLQFLLLPLSSRSKERAQTLVCGRSFCFLIKLDGIVRGIDMVDNVRESLHYGYSPVQ